MFDVRLDDEGQLVRVRITDILSLEDITRFNQEMGEAARVARRRYGYFRLLADGTSGLVQPAELASSYVTPGQLLEGPDERWAVVVTSTLAKMQVRRYLADDRAQGFLSLSEAQAWLTSAASYERAIDRAFLASNAG